MKGISAIKLPNLPPPFSTEQIGPGPVVCLNSKNTNSILTGGSKFNRFCNFDYPTQSPRNYEMSGLYVKGQGAVISITTTDISPVTLIINGDIDISNGGKICHRDKSNNAKCGSGKPQNLTLQVPRKFIGGESG